MRKFSVMTAAMIFATVIAHGGVTSAHELGNSHVHTNAVEAGALADGAARTEDLGNSHVHTNVVEAGALADGAARTEDLGNSHVHTN